jgi:hypothetical protein
MENNHMLRDRRKNFRVEWNSPGTIYDREGGSGYHCIVKDLSNGGVKISGVAVADVPDQFTLYIAGDSKTRKCEVLWRKADSLGVRFTDLPALADKSTALHAKKAKRGVLV